MGRLRTAVHNFSDLDLVPEELMARLDDLVIRLDRDEGRPAGGEQRPGPAGDADGSVLTGATCLYVVYDPVRRQCVMARAGHPLPVLILPDGTADFPRVRDCPALGLGGQPFESLTVDVPENSRLRPVHGRPAQAPQPGAYHRAGVAAAGTRPSRPVTAGDLRRRARRPGARPARPPRGRHRPPGGTYTRPGRRTPRLLGRPRGPRDGRRDTRGGRTAGSPIGGWTTRCSPRN